MDELREIEKLHIELDFFYDSKSYFRKMGEIRLLQLFVTKYEIFASEEYGFIYDSFNETGKVAVLRKILEFKPDIILTQDFTFKAKLYYDHKHILYINDNDYSAYIQLLPYMKIQKNEIHFYAYKGCNNLFRMLYGDDVIYRHVVYKNLTPSIIFSRLGLEIPDKFDTDIVIVSGANSSISQTKKYIEGLCGSWMKNVETQYLKNKIENGLLEMLKYFYSEMDKTGALIEEEDNYVRVFEGLLGDAAKEFEKISLEEKKYFYSLLRLLIGYGTYRRLIIKWICESGYKVELWGDSWEEEFELKKFYKGKVDDREELAHIYNRSKICLFTNPDIGIHTSVFEIISSKSLCLAYQNDNITKASLKEYFTDGKSIVFYKNRQELLEKIDLYLKDNSQRNMVIEEGYRIVQEKKMYWEYQLTEIVEKAVELAKGNMGIS